jgi:tRNA A37 methylthiotransferase MiaB
LAANIREGLVPFSETKRRSGVMSSLARKIALEKNKHWLGWEGEVLVDEVGKVPGSWIGRNHAYKPIVVQSNDDLLGKILRVKIVNAFSTYLEGELI